MTLFHHLSYLVLHFALFIPFQLFQLFMLFQLLHHTKLSQQCSSASSGTGTNAVCYSPPTSSRLKLYTMTLI